MTLAPVSNRQERSVDDEGYFEVPDEHVAAVRDRLASVYDVEYDGADVVPPEPDETDDAADEADTGGDEDGDQNDATGYTREDLEGKEFDEVKEIFAELGGDTDDVDMRKRNEVEAAVLRLQADAEEE